MIDAAEEACISASREILARAIYHQTDVVVEVGGEVKKVHPNDIINKKLLEL
ncbi:hypothetical protein [Alteromonas macleodii]|uniref:hypothetical protein n=1 Tax=Alteromonas macleodii TaxID=28108 RepID=UPI000A7D790F|nr:hypothetical protein [Alteromonas macleodii]